MTDYLDFVPDEYAVGAPATALHFERWFRNPVAMFEGAPDAPRLANRAHPEFGVGVIVLDYVTPLGLDIPIGFYAGEGSGGTVFDYYWCFTAMRSGSLRITANIKVSSASQTGRIAIFRNTTLLAESTSSSTSDDTKLFDFIFDEGDQITVRGGLNYTSVGGTAYINTLTVKGDRRGVYRA